MHLHSHPTLAFNRPTLACVPPVLFSFFAFLLSDSRRLRRLLSNTFGDSSSVADHKTHFLFLDLLGWHYLDHAKLEDLNNTHPLPEQAGAHKSDLPSESADTRLRL